MVAPASPLPKHPHAVEVEHRVLLHDVPWSTYVVLRDSIESRAVRMTYLEGLLEIMTTSRGHEVEKKLIARLLELFCLERDIPLYGYGSMTFRKEEKQRGLEPDECYCRDRDKDIPDISQTRARPRCCEMQSDPVLAEPTAPSAARSHRAGGPAGIVDIALEVVKSHGAIDKLEVYRGLGVREIWVFEDGAFALFELRGDAYTAIETSAVLPEVDLARLAHFAVQTDQHAALVAYRAELRG